MGEGRVEREGQGLSARAEARTLAIVWQRKSISLCHLGRWGEWTMSVSGCLGRSQCEIFFPALSRHPPSRFLSVLCSPPYVFFVLPCSVRSSIFQVVKYCSFPPLQHCPSVFRFTLLSLPVPSSFRSHAFLTKETGKNGGELNPFFLFFLAQGQDKSQGQEGTASPLPPCRSFWKGTRA